MLRRQVEDVESKLPPKVPVVVKVAMSPYQSTIYGWIKASGGWVEDPCGWHGAEPGVELAPHSVRLAAAPGLSGTGGLGGSACGAAGRVSARCPSCHPGRAGRAASTWPCRCGCPPACLPARLPARPTPALARRRASILTLTLARSLPLPAPLPRPAALPQARCAWTPPPPSWASSGESTPRSTTSAWSCARWVGVRCWGLGACTEAGGAWKASAAGQPPAPPPPTHTHTHTHTTPTSATATPCLPRCQVCNHPMLSYPPETWAVGDAIVRQCGKMLVLDRLLVKMKVTGHRCAGGASRGGSPCGTCGVAVCLWLRTAGGGCPGRGPAPGAAVSARGFLGLVLQAIPACECCCSPPMPACLVACLPALPCPLSSAGYCCSVP